MVGASVLTPLVVVLTASMMALLLQGGLISPHNRIAQTLDSLMRSIPETAAPESERRYGACGDICTVSGACRHVVLHGGLHGGQKVPMEVLTKAESCR
ncbi:hypothetical protein [Nevskia ramosa]|uniref:hypothetical protein n=1 Tax=Nevskia ramosa TaxID=64002 RepID=UPI003D0A38BC